MITKLKKNIDVTEALNNSYYYFNLLIFKVGILLVSHGPDRGNDRRRYPATVTGYQLAHHMKRTDLERTGNNRTGQKG